MGDNPYYHQDDPTEPTIHHPPTPQQGQQGKLVIGNFKDAPKRPERKPYYYPNGANQPPARQGQSGQPGQPGQSRQPGTYQQGQGTPQQQRFQPGQQGQQGQQGPQPGAYPPRQQMPQNQQVPPVAPASVPGGPQYPYHQLAQMPGTPGPGVAPTKRAPRSRRRGCTIGCLSVLLILVILLVIGGVLGQRVLAFGSAISTQSPLSTQTGYMNTSDRVNILVLGYGGSGHSGAYLTDSMMVMSLLPSSHHTTLISVPRDLWVQVPEGSGNYGKINSVYENAAGYTNTNPVSGGNAAAQKVSLITGLNVQYWVTINFAGFKDFIDSIGGVDVNVPDSFNACYPKNDNASVDASWIKIQFNKGLQHMNGATAIEYARAREPVEVCNMGTSENLAELSDFARSQRQQLIIKAALAKVKSISTWPSMYSALSALEKTVYTNLSLADLAQFALKMDLNNAHRVGLSNQNVLVDSTVGGQYALLPQNNNWQLIKNYVQQQLYS